MYILSGCLRIYVSKHVSRETEYETLMSKSASANEPENITFRQVNYILYVLLKEKNRLYCIALSSVYIVYL